MPRKIKKQIDPETLEISNKRKNILKKIRKPRKKSIIPSNFKKSIDELTEQELEDRKDAIRDFLPKIDINAGIRKIDLKKDHEECAKITEFSCFRPDVYLDYGCFECSLYKYCKCPIKMKNKRKR